MRRKYTWNVLLPHCMVWAERKVEKLCVTSNENFWRSHGFGHKQTDQPDWSCAETEEIKKMLLEQCIQQTIRGAKGVSVAVDWLWSNHMQGTQKHGPKWPLDCFHNTRYWLNIYEPQVYFSPFWEFLLSHCDESKLCDTHQVKIKALSVHRHVTKSCCNIFACIILQHQLNCVLQELV